jgi:hypothetical protein
MYPALAIGVAVVLALYLCAQHWNARLRRNRATRILRRLEEALAGRGHVINFHWLAETQFEAALRFASSNFKRSSIRVEFSDSTLPLKPWLWRARAESERLVFNSDLEAAPRFRLSVLNQRWTAQSGKIKCLEAAKWNYEPVIPVIFTTASDWSPELAATVVTSRSNQQQFQDVQFRQSSPHFSASMPLHIFSEGENHLEFFTALRDLAAEVSTAAQSPGN